MNLVGVFAVYVLQRLQGLPLNPQAFGAVGPDSAFNTAVSLYPGAATLVCMLVFPSQIRGSVIECDGRAVGSELLGQMFSAPRYSWSRPSATVPVPYNGAASSGSNQGPINPALEAAVSNRIAALRAADLGNPQPVPVDLVTAPGSGLDPHISLPPPNTKSSVSRGLAGSTRLWYVHSCDLPLKGVHLACSVNRGSTCSS